MSIHPYREGDLFYLYSSIAQSVERMTVNHDVTGSSPVRGAKGLARKCESFFYGSELNGLKPVTPDRTIIVRSGNQD